MSRTDCANAGTARRSTGSDATYDFERRALVVDLLVGRAARKHANSADGRATRRAMPPPSHIPAGDAASIRLGEPPGNDPGQGVISRVSARSSGRASPATTARARIPHQGSSAWLAPRVANRVSVRTGSAPDPQGPRSRAHSRQAGCSSFAGPPSVAELPFFSAGPSMKSSRGPYCVGDDHLAIADRVQRRIVRSWPTRRPIAPATCPPNARNLASTSPRSLTPTPTSDGLLGPHRDDFASPSWRRRQRFPTALLTRVPVSTTMRRGRQPGSGQRMPRMGDPIPTTRCLPGVWRL